MKQSFKTWMQKIFSTSNSLGSSLNQTYKHSEDIFWRAAPENAFHTALLRKLLRLQSRGIGAWREKNMNESKKEEDIGSRKQFIQPRRAMKGNADQQRSSGLTVPQEQDDWGWVRWSPGKREYNWEDGRIGELVKAHQSGQL